MFKKRWVIFEQIGSRPPYYFIRVDDFYTYKGATRVRDRLQLENTTGTLYVVRRLP